MTEAQEQDERTGPAVLEVQRVSMVPEPEDDDAITGPTGWVLKVVPKHHCNLPTIDTRTFVGSVWRCGECGQYYLVYERRGEKQGEKALRRISEDSATERLAKASQQA